MIFNKKAIFLFFIICHFLSYSIDFRIVSRAVYKDAADFVYDHGLQFNPNKVFKGATVYLNGELAPQYWRDVHSKIKNPYIMLYSGGGLYGSILDDSKIVHFFCLGGDGPLKNNHSKYSYIPLGICSIKSPPPSPSLISSLQSMKKRKIGVYEFYYQYECACSCTCFQYL